MGAFTTRTLRIKDITKTLLESDRFKSVFGTSLNPLYICHIIMNNFRNSSELMKTLIALCVLSAYAYGLGIHSNPADSNSIYEIIVDDHISPSKDEISFTELYVKSNSKDKLQIDEQADNNVNENVRLNVQNPSYIDNGPPPYTETARMARYIVHYSEWTSIATISIQEPIKGYPFANIFSMSDGSSVANSSGVPYFYVPSLEMSVHDLKKDSRISATMSLAQGSYCKQKNLDPEDPRCAHLILSGRFMPIKKGSKEEDFAKDALFSRHPAMKDWNSPSHGWFFAKVNITNILLLDYFGGAATIPVEDYFKATPY